MLSLREAARTVGTGVAIVALGGVGGAAAGVATNAFESHPTPIVSNGQPKPSESTLSNGAPSESATVTAAPENFDLSKIGLVGEDAWSQDINHWSLIIDKPTGRIVGAFLEPNPNGTASLIHTTDFLIVQTSLHANVAGEYQSLVWTVRPDTTMLADGGSFYPIGNQTGPKAAEISFGQQLTTEKSIQPGVYVAEVCTGVQALPANKQDLSNPVEWPRVVLSINDVIKYYGVPGDGWTDKPNNWSYDGVDNAWILATDPSGVQHVIQLNDPNYDSIALVSWDVKTGTAFPRMPGIMETGTSMPVRGATVYGGIPKGLGKDAANYAFKQMLNNEIDGSVSNDPKIAQPGVVVIQVCKTEQAGSYPVASVPQNHDSQRHNSSSNFPVARDIWQAGARDAYARGRKKFTSGRTR
jgi:hypothetical protein